MLGTMMAQRDGDENLLVKIAHTLKLVVTIQKNLFMESIPPGTYVEVEFDDTSDTKQGRIINILRTASPEITEVGGFVSLI